MNKKRNSFAIYCSGSASRTVKLFSQEENLVNYKPKIVIYDGMQKEIINVLEKLFGDSLIIFDKNTLTEKEAKRIHTSTSKFIHKKLIENDVDFLLCFGSKILKKDLIDNYPKRLINFHPSLLPSFKGLKAIEQAMQYRAPFLGNTAHYIDEGVDTGEVILQTAMLTEDYETYEDVFELQLPMIKMVLRDILKYDITDVEIFKEISKRRKIYLIPSKCNQNVFNN